MKIYVFGSSLTSCYWNGAATYYRGIYKNLHQLGHLITFAEPDVYNRQEPGLPAHRVRDGACLSDSARPRQSSLGGLPVRLNHQAQWSRGGRRTARGGSLAVPDVVLEEAYRILGCGCAGHVGASRRELTGSISQTDSSVRFHLHLWWRRSRHSALPEPGRAALLSDLQRSGS